MKLDHISSRLTVNERFMLHILAYQAYQEAWEVPHGITQKGVADGIGINRGEVPRAAKALKKLDMVYDERKHILGETRKKVVYFLSRKGLQEAVKIKNHLVAKGYEPEDVIEKPKPPEVRKRSHSLPGVDYFFGREAEVQTLEETFGMKKKPLLFIYGMAGIGKTTLVLNFISTAGEKHPVVFHRCQSFDSLEYVVRSIGKQIGFQDLDGHVNLIIRDVIDKLLKTKCIFFLDDINKLNPQVLVLVELIKERLEQWGEKSTPMFIFTSRDQPRIYDVRDLKIKKTVKEINLKELDRRSSLSFIDHLGKQDPGRMGRFSKTDLYKMTRGYPLAIELVQMGKGVGYGDFDDFIKEEILPSLTTAQKKMLTYLSCYRNPFNMDALRIPDQNLFDIADFDGLVSKRIIRKDLIQVDWEVKELYALHDSIRQFFSRRVLPKDSPTFYGWCRDYYQHQLDDSDELAVDMVSDVRELFHFLISGNQFKEALTLLDSKFPALREANYHEEAMVMVSRVLAETSVRKRPGVTKKDILRLKQLREEVLEVWGRWDVILEHMFFCNFLKIWLKQNKGRSPRIKYDYQMLSSDGEMDSDDAGQVRTSIKELEAIGDTEGVLTLYKELGWRGLLKINKDPVKDIDRGLELVQDDLTRAEMEFIKAELLFQKGDRKEVIKLTKELLNAPASKRGRVFVLTLLATALMVEKKREKALSFFYESLAEAVESLNINGINYSRLHVIGCAYLLGDEMPLDDLEKVNRSFYNFQDVYGMFFSDVLLAFAHRDLGDSQKGAQILQKALRNYRGFDIRMGSFIAALETLKYHING